MICVYATNVALAALNSLDTVYWYCEKRIKCRRAPLSDLRVVTHLPHHRRHMLARYAAYHLRWLAKLAQEGAAHAFAVAEAGVAGYGVH